MKQYKSFWVFPIVALALLIATPTLAAKDHKGGHEKKWLTELNLTEEQEAKLDEIRKVHHEKLKDKRQSMKEANSQLKEALKSDTSDASLRKQFAAIQALRNEFATARFEKILAIRAILTPEQRQKFEGMRGKRRHGPRHKQKPADK